MTSGTETLYFSPNQPGIALKSLLSPSLHSTSVAILCSILSTLGLECFFSDSCVVQCIHRYSTTPAPLPTGKKELYGQPSPSFYQNSFSPDSPNPREVDAILRNTFAGSLSPLSQRCEGGRGGGEGVAYDTLREGEETRESNEDSYVLMQSSLV